MMSKNTVKNDIESRIVAIEKGIKYFKLIGTCLAALGLSLGGVLWHGYGKLKESEASLSKDFANLQHEYFTAQEKINDLKAESARVFSSSLDRYDKMSESYLELRKNVTKASEEASLALTKAGDLSRAVVDSIRAAERSEKAMNENAKILEDVKNESKKASSSCVAIQDAQRALEEYLGKVIKDRSTEKSSAPSIFTVEISGSSSTCTFIDGVSVPYSRKISGSFSNSIVIVPENSVCIVKVRSAFCEVKIKQKLQGRVIVDSSGSSCDVRYIQ